jgi:hypothetical protein
MKFMALPIDVNYGAILEVVKNLRASFHGDLHLVTPLGDPKPYVNTIQRPMDSVSVKEKSARLQELSNQIKSYDPKNCSSHYSIIRNRATGLDC